MYRVSNLGKEFPDLLVGALVDSDIGISALFKHLKGRLKGVQDTYGIL